MGLGNPGDVKALGKGLFEMRIDHGPGYRAYYFRHAQEIVVLLAGGDKKMQERDIVTAFELMEAVKATWPK
ncbi:MAG: type II toxin-antitoxin system RelE/ParE family toxin [Rhizomicrobium sp.]